MINNKYVGIALVSLLVLILGAMATIIVLFTSERPVRADGAALGRYIVVTMQVGPNDDALAVMDTSKNTIVLYRCWGGNTFYPVSGRKIDQDHRYLELLKRKQFQNVRSLEAAFMPNAIQNRLDERTEK